MVRAIQFISQNLPNIANLHKYHSDHFFPIKPQGSILKTYNVNVTLHSKIITSIRRSTAITIVTWSGKTVSF
ncbi:uncharacterized protein METZ01_LOCUS516797 [marine metagenome]|uniref:Uncharacterized protein n=1 Tax=marine metagenome TaxID=408172 RepID=A0A383F5I8_9ZZZZ